MPIQISPSSTRARGDLRVGFTPYTSAVGSSLSPQTRDWPLENPWIPASAVPKGQPVDEQHWLLMETDSSVFGAISARIATLLGGGVALEAGEGEGAEELLEFWEDQLAELPLVTMSALGLMSFFRGWRPFEIVGAQRPWRGRSVFAPVLVRSSLSWQFRHTVGRDLWYRGGLGIDRKLFRRRILGGQMKWFCPAMGDLGNPYGFPIHRNWMAMDMAYRELSAIGMAHIRMSQGVLVVDEGGDLASAFNDDDKARIKKVGDSVRAFIDEMQAGGALVRPAGWNIDWLALPSAVGGWTGLFEFFNAAARSYYNMSNLSTSATGASGNRALAAIQDQVGRRVAKLDACQYLESFRVWLRAWSSANASIIAPKAFPGSGTRPQILDVPLRAVPHLVFLSLNRLTADDLAVLNAVATIGVTVPEGLSDSDRKAAKVLVKVKSILRTHNVPLFDEGQVGGILDLSRKEAPPPPIAAGPQVVEEDPDEEPEPEEDESAPG